MTVFMWIVAAVLAFFALGQITVGQYEAAMVLTAVAFVVSPPGTARLFPTRANSGKFRGWMAIGAVVVWIVTIANTLPDAPATPQAADIAELEELDRETSTVVARDTPPAPVVRAPPNAPIQTKPTTPVDVQASADKFPANLPTTTRSRARELWGELKSHRYNARFHQYGFSRAGPLGSWETRRKALYGEWQDYARNGPGVDPKDMMLGSVIHYMFSVGQDWYRSAGQGDANSATMIQEIEAELQ